MRGDNPETLIGDVARRRAPAALMSGGVPSATVSVLFTDIEASTRQWEESADMSARVEQHFDVLRTAVQHAGGEVFATMASPQRSRQPMAPCGLRWLRSAHCPRPASRCGWGSTPARSSGSDTICAGGR